MPSEEKTQEKGDFVIDLNGWNYKDLTAWRNAVRNEQIEEFGPLTQQIIVSWPFAIDPKAEGAVENLGIADLAVLMRAINIAVGNAFSQGN